MARRTTHKLVDRTARILNSLTTPNAFILVVKDTAMVFALFTDTMTSRRVARNDIIALHSAQYIKRAPLRPKYRKVWPRGRVFKLTKRGHRAVIAYDKLSMFPLPASTDARQHMSAHTRWRMTSGTAR